MVLLKSQCNLKKKTYDEHMGLFINYVTDESGGGVSLKRYSPCCRYLGRVSYASGQGGVKFPKISLRNL